MNHHSIIVTMRRNLVMFERYTIIAFHKYECLYEIKINKFIFRYHTQYIYIYTVICWIYFISLFIHKYLHKMSYILINQLTLDKQMNRVNKEV